jgi:hypothetical protein
MVRVPLLVTGEPETENIFGTDSPTLVTYDNTGMSAATSARYVGAPDPPLAGPASTSFCPALERENVSAGVVVGLATDVVNNGLRFPALKLETVPLPPPADVKEMLLPATLNVTVAEFIKFAGAGTGVPLTFTEPEMLPNAASMSKKLSVVTSSVPQRPNPRLTES